MSAQSIARWNAIPMERPENEEAHSLKRSRGEDDGVESDDNVSLVSRSPSPPSPGAMDIDKYDEYHSGPEKEVITVDTKIKSTNKGFAMLAKLGWVEGQPLGLTGDGRVDPVPFYIKNDLTGLGKSNQDVRMIESTVSQRRELDSERQNKETEEQRRARKELIAKRAAVQSEVSAALRPFYCELCDKQFKNVAQYDEHTNSYAHHHKARFRDLQAAQRANSGTQEELDKRKEKERKREEKELRKLAKAAGVKLPKPAAPPQPTASVDSNTVSLSMDDGSREPSGLNNASSASASSSSSTPMSGPSSVRAPGWTSLGSVNDVPSRVSQVDERPPPSSGPTGTTPNPGVGAAPAFRTGGWSSLDTTGAQPSASTTVTAQAPLPLLPPSTVASITSTGFSRGGWPSSSTLNAPSHPTLQPPNPLSLPHPDSAQPSVTTVARPPSPPKKAAKSSQRQESARSGWQQFRAGGPSRHR